MLNCILGLLGSKPMSLSVWKEEFEIFLYGTYDRGFSTPRNIENVRFVYELYDAQLYFSTYLSGYHQILSIFVEIKYLKNMKGN